MDVEGKEDRYSMLHFLSLAISLSSIGGMTLG